MQPLWPLLAGFLLLAPPPTPVEDAANAHAPALQQYAALDAAARPQWLQRLLARLDRASRLLLEPEELARQQARISVLQQQLAEGQALPPAEIASLLAVTDQREKQAVERLARRFRIQVYQTFRQHRGMFTRRREAWNRVRASWEAAGEQFDQQDRLLDWLELALRRSLPDSPGPLPADPKFEIAEKPLQALVATEPAEQFREPLASPAAPLPVPLPQPTLGPPGPTGSRRATAQWRPPLAEPTPTALVSAISPASAAPRRVAGGGPSTAMAAVLPSPTASHGPAESPHSLRVTPEPAPPPTAPTAALPPASPRADPSTVQVNLDELTARIAGVNLELRALEAELDEQASWDAQGLQALLERLRGIVQRSSDLQVVRDLLPADRRTQIDRIESPTAAIAVLSAKIADARDRAAAGDSPGSETGRQSQVHALDRLSQQLAELAPSK